MDVYDIRNLFKHREFFCQYVHALFTVMVQTLLNFRSLISVFTTDISR